MWGVVRASEIDPGHSVRVSEAGPRGRFRSSRRLVESGAPADVAIRSDGTALAVFRSGEDMWDPDLWAAVNAPGARFRRSEAIAERPVESPTATFTPRRPSARRVGDANRNSREHARRALTRDLVLVCQHEV